MCGQDQDWWIDGHEGISLMLIKLQNKPGYRLHETATLSTQKAGRKQESKEE